MDDIFSSLISGAPTDPEKQRVLAQALRKQSLMGQLAMASGDRVLAPLGKNLSAGAESGAQDIATEREKQEALDTQEYWHKIQERHYNDQVEYQKNKDIADNAARLAQTKLLVGGRQDVADANNATKEAVEAAKEAARQQKAALGKPLPGTLGKDLMQLRDSTDGVKAALDSYQPGFGGFGRGLINVIGSTSLGSAHAKEAQNWWANYGRGFTLDEMNRLYKSRLTTNEMEIFRKYHITENMSDAQIQQNLTQIHALLAKKLTLHGAELANQGYSPEGIKTIVGEDPIAAAGAGSPSKKYLPPFGGQPAPQGNSPVQNFMLQQTLQGQQPGLSMSPGAPPNLFSGPQNGF